MNEALWDTLTFGGPSLRWFARSQSGIAGGTVFSPKALSRLIHNLSPQWDLYFGVNHSPKRGGVRVSSEDITEWRTVLLDIDPTEPDANPQAAAAEYASRAASLLGREVSGLVVDSGRGVQVHLHLTPMALEAPDDRSRVRHAVGTFLRLLVGSDAAPLFGCILDLSCSDLARVARMPNTINHKTGRMTQLISDSRQPSVPVVGVSRVDPQSILALAPVALHRVDKHPISDGLKYQQVWSRLTATAQRFLDEGAMEGGRHRTCVAAVKSLQENGVPAGEAERVIRLASERCTPPLGYGEALRIIQAAYRR